MGDKIKEGAAKETDDMMLGIYTALLPEFDRLRKQTCPYCSGYGHAGKDCPTDAKIKHLRGGIREQNKALLRLRK